MEMEDRQGIEEKLDELKQLLRRLVALHLAAAGASQDDIARSLRLSKATVNQMLKGTRKPPKGVASG